MQTYNPATIWSTRAGRVRCVQMRHVRHEPADRERVREFSIRYEHGVKRTKGEGEGEGDGEGEEEGEGGKQEGGKDNGVESVGKIYISIYVYIVWEFLFILRLFRSRRYLTHLSIH